MSEWPKGREKSKSRLDFGAGYAAGLSDGQYAEGHPGRRGGEFWWDDYQKFLEEKEKESE